MTDYVYEYDQNWTQIGASYKEDGVKEFSNARIQFQNDSTKISEWMDSTRRVLHTFIDNLNHYHRTYKTASIKDELEGYDSTSYTMKAFVELTFFTNVEGEIFNDRRFISDSINVHQDWIVRKKIIQDTIVEIHFREILYDCLF